MSQEFVDLPDSASPLKVSPQKFGKAAYAQLSYTPSRLKENLLYIEATTLKKEEEKNSKLRQISAENDLLVDRVDQLKLEKKGIEDSLNQQISMYKRLIEEKENKFQIKIRDIQNQFKEQMRVIIRQQQEKAKFVQAEQQRYEEQINDLKRRNADLEGKLNEAKKILAQLNEQRRKLHLSQKQITFQLEEAKQNQYDELKYKMFENQQRWKANLHKASLQKDAEVDNLKRQSLHDLSKLQQKHASETLVKNSQIQQITQTFNSEVSRLNSQLKQRQETIESLKHQLSLQKQNLLQVTKNYDRQINSLIFQKNKVVGALDAAKVHNFELVQKQKVLLTRPLGFNIEADCLRQLLVQSYNELQKCKQELLWLEKDRSRLLAQGAGQYLIRSRRY